MAMYMEIKQGDIYYIPMSGYQVGMEMSPGRPAVVVSATNDGNLDSIIEIVYCTTHPIAALPTHPHIKSSGRLSVCLCEQIQTIAIKRLGDYIGHCTDEELEAVKKACCLGVGVDLDAGKPNTEQKPEQNTQPQTDNLAAIREITNERDFYRKAYEDLITKMLGGNR